MIASKYRANYCHYACFPPEIRKIMSKSGSWINNHLFTYTPYNSPDISVQYYMYMPSDGLRPASSAAADRAVTKPTNDALQCSFIVTFIFAY